jgi:hypothetical protein
VHLRATAIVDDVTGPRKPRRRHSCLRVARILRHNTIVLVGTRKPGLQSVV